MAHGIVLPAPLGKAQFSVVIQLQTKNVPELRYLHKVVTHGWYRVDVD
jgi:hypothetical protein